MYTKGAEMENREFMEWKQNEDGSWRAEMKISCLGAHVFRVNNDTWAAMAYYGSEPLNTARGATKELALQACLRANVKLLRQIAMNAEIEVCKMQQAARAGKKAAGSDQ